MKRNLVVVSICSRDISDLVYGTIKKEIRDKYIIFKSERGFDIEYNIPLMLRFEKDLPKDFLDNILVLNLPDRYSVVPIRLPEALEINTGFIIGKDLIPLYTHNRCDSSNLGNINVVFEGEDKQIVYVFDETHRGGHLLDEDINKIKQYIVPIDEIYNTPNITESNTFLI